MKNEQRFDATPISIDLAGTPESVSAIRRADPPVYCFQPLRPHALGHLKPSSGNAPKVLTISAPVGYGKTVLMSMMHAELKRTGRQAIWFALDDRDTMTESVVSGLEALLNGHELKLHPTQALFRGQTPIETRIDELIDLVNDYQLPLTIFIDNINCCTEISLGALLNKLIFNTKISKQIVLSSTRDIPIDLASAQLQGLVKHIGPTELSFSIDEIGNLLGSDVARVIGREGLENIARQTEGWPAAVRMVQIILSNSADPHLALKDFSGSDEGLARFLNKQVLSAFSPQVREFLYCVAQVRTFTSELCEVIMGTDSAKEYLIDLIDKNVFVIPLDRNRHWYRLHGLFRDYLLREAEKELTTAQRQTVLTRAANWCKKNGHWRESVEYALASKSATTASEILETVAPSCIRNSGLIMQYIQWVEALHELGHQAGPEAEYWFIWALAFHRRYDYARRQSAALVTSVEKKSTALDEISKSNLLRKIAILRASIDSLSDHLQEAHIGASTWLVNATNQTDDPFNHAAANCIECGYYSRLFRFVEARDAINNAHEAAFQLNSPYVDGWVASYAALIQIYEGNFSSAYSTLVPALTSIRSKLGEDTGIYGTMSMVASKCAAEMGLIDEAWQLFKTGSKTSRTHGFLESAACGLEAAVMLWDGDSEDRISIVQLRGIANAYAPRLSLMLSCYLIRRMLVLGKHEDALKEAGRIGLDAEEQFSYKNSSSETLTPHLDALISDTRIAMLLASGKIKQAEHLITEQIRYAKATSCSLRLVELSLASATISLRTNEQALAIRHVTQAIKIATGYGIVRPFIEQSASLSAIVADTKISAWGFATPDEKRFFVERCRDLTFTNQSFFEKISTLHDESPSLFSDLTERENEMLGYVDVGLSNQQIADHIDISLTTVKWHLKNLYTKLNVKNRSAALAKARALNLLAK
jgi:LuxR family maltose regulon positive regulatory protein